MKIALAGNPNSGKTTLFNTLTGASAYVGNWPGVTVEKKEGKYKGNKEIIIQDLPGIYSLSPYTLEEVVARNYLLNEKPDVIINIVDATNLERNLYLTTQLAELNIPIIIALNMMDVIEKRKESIQVSKLEKELGIPICEISALRKKGIEELVTKATSLSVNTYKMKFSVGIEQVLVEIENQIQDDVPKEELRFYAIKVFEGDEKIMSALNLPKSKLSNIGQSKSNLADEDFESIITNERYNYITSLVDGIYKKKDHTTLTISDKIDRIVTNRWLALPIFAVIIFLVYFLAITTVGGILSDFVNDGLFGEGFSFFGLFEVNSIPGYVTTFLEYIHCAPWMTSLVVDGIIGGVGAVLGFLPQMLVLFLLLGILEDCGYMSRIAFILDRIFRKFGLSGKSFIPMLVSTGCAVPGVMASRTIETERDRKMTIMTTTFMPCSAKLPIIALIAGALFGNAWWVGASAYFIGIGAIILSGIILKKLKWFEGNPAPFIMELPAYHLPSAGSLTIHVWDRLKSFAKKAGTIILLSAIVLWFLQGFNWRFQMVESAEDSILASIGHGLSFVFAPLGFNNWKAAVATITGLIAKENVVSTYGILYGFAEVGESGEEFWSILAADYTALASYSFLIFNLLCAPCFAAIGAIRREMGTNKWTWIAIVFQTLFAYCVALIVYQFGNLFIGNFTAFTIPAVLVFLGFVYLLVRPDKIIKKRKEMKLNVSK